MKGDTRKYLSPLFHKSVKAQRITAEREANDFLKRERLICTEWRLVPFPNGLWRIEITGVER